MNTYRKLKETLDKMTDEQLDCNLSIHDEISDEYYPVEVEVKESEADDVLDRGHPFLEVIYP
jgi:hypothetical protein